MDQNLTRGQVQDSITEKAASDESYRDKLLTDPKAVLSEAIGEQLPDQIDVKVVEETSNVIYLIAPQKQVAEGDELSDDDLQKVAGGLLDKFDCKAGAAALSMASQINLKLG